MVKRIYLSSLYPWETIHVGGNFLVPDKTIGQISRIAWRFSRKLGVKFACRTDYEDGRKVGVRVYRVK